MTTADLLTTREAAVILGISRRRVQQLCQDGRLGTLNGRDWLFTRAELESFRQKPRPPGRPRLNADPLQR